MHTISVRVEHTNNKLKDPWKHIEIVSTNSLTSRNQKYLE